MVARTPFASRRVTGTETLGERLRAAREAAGVRLEDVHRTTGIQLRYLDAIERNAYDELPGEVYTRKFLQVYADALDLNPRTALKVYDAERSVAPRSHDDRQPLFQTTPRQRDFAVTPRMVRNTLAALVLVAVIGYLGYGIQSSLKPPSLEVTAPADNAVTDVDYVNVQGQTEVESTVTINGQEILADPEGRFDERVYLQEGINQIRVTAARNDGRENILLRNVLYRPTTEALTFMTP